MSSLNLREASFFMAWLRAGIRRENGDGFVIAHKDYCIVSAYKRKASHSAESVSVLYNNK